VRRRRRHATRKLVSRAAVAGLALASLGLGYTATAANTMPSSNATSQSFAITASSLAPPECSGLSLTTVVAATGSYTGNGDELVLGSSGSDSIKDFTPNNCLVLGAGSDSVNLKGSPQYCIVNASVNASKCTAVWIRP